MGGVGGWGGAKDVLDPLKNYRWGGAGPHYFYAYVLLHVRPFFNSVHIILRFSL